MCHCYIFCKWKSLGIKVRLEWRIDNYCPQISHKQEAKTEKGPCLIFKDNGPIISKIGKSVNAFGM
jgi:hypothetical protein